MFYRILKSIKSILINQKTSLNKKCKNGQCLASEFDNIFYNISKTKVRNTGIIRFYKNFNSLNEAIKISDNIPIWVKF